LGPKISMNEHVHRSGILHGVRKNLLLGVENMKMSLQSPNNEFGAKNQYGVVIHPSIGNFTWSKKKFIFGGQKHENEPSEPKQ
jgi:hypothetical protein